MSLMPLINSKDKNTYLKRWVICQSSKKRSNMKKFRDLQQLHICSLSHIYKSHNMALDIYTFSLLYHPGMLYLISLFLILYWTGSLLSSKPSNMKTADWMPQNDILGQARTRLFLSHVGHNSIYEAAYHGVPFIGFPMWSDQPENARQITRAGMGLWVEDELHTSVSRVLSEPRYIIQNIWISNDWIICVNTLFMSHLA